MPPIVLRSAPGVTRDATRFNAQAHSDARWCRWDNGLPRKIGGYRRITNELAAPATGIHSFSRNGETYIHVGTAEGIQQIRINPAGVVTGVTIRTPGMVAPDPRYSWKFQVIYDPFENNAATIIAHSAVHLDEMDTDTQRPAFFGPVTGTSPLEPISVPVSETGYEAQTFTGDTTIGSNVITNVASTAGLRFGQTVTGPNIPAGAFISSFTSNSVTLQTGKDATASASTQTFSASVGGSCGGIVVLYPYLFFYGSSGRIAHSTASNFNDFWSLGSNEAFITGQKIVQAMPTRGGGGNSPAGLFWSLDSLIRCSFIGGDAVFAFDTISDGITIMSPRSVVEYGGAHFWLGVDGFYVYAGAIRPLPNPFNLDFLLRNINTLRKNRTFAFRNSRHNELWWCVPLGNSQWPNHAFVFNVQGQFWYDTPLPNAGRSGADSALTFPYPLMGGVDMDINGGFRLWQHEFGVNELDGSQTTAIRSFYTTGDIHLLEGQQPQDKELQVVRIEPDFVQSGEMSVTVTGSQNAKAGDVEEASATFPADPDDQRDTIVQVKASRRQMRFRFESNEVDGDYWAGKPLAIVNPTGGRAT
jgi:hypothetical protein